MKINIKATKIDLTPELREYAEEKMNMLEKYLGEVKATICDLELENTNINQNKGEIFRCEVNLALPGELLRVEKTEEDIYKAIDKVKDHMMRSIKRYKEKRIESSRK
jgi:putative sigma-54 modulation protein